MRAVAIAAMLAAACAQAGQPRIGGDDTGGDDTAPIDAPTGSMLPDACADDDMDTVCNTVDKCMGHNDAIDTDADTVADGCDKCAGVDDRPDLIANQMPDCLEYVMRTIPLKVVGSNKWRGWHSNGGGHDTSNDNTLTGENTAQFYNSYFVFPLTGFTATAINQATLQIQLEVYTSGDANETFSIWDVTTPAATVETTANDINIYNDLMMGTQYATMQVTAGQLNQVLSVPLNAMAATHATQKLNTDFVVGVHLDTAPGWIRFGQTGTGTGSMTTINLVIKYLP